MYTFLAGTVLSGLLIGFLFWIELKDGILIDIIKWLIPESIVEERGILTNYTCKLFPKTALVREFLSRHEHGTLDGFLEYLRSKNVCDSLITTVTAAAYRHEVSKYLSDDAGV